MERLTSIFWVRAYLARLNCVNIPAYIVRSGEEQAGAILVKVNTLDGNACVFQRSFDLSVNRRIWTLLDEGKEQDLDAMLDRQRQRDPDLWIVEVEDRDGRHLLDEPGLSD